MLILRCYKSHPPFAPLCSYAEAVAQTYKAKAARSQRATRNAINDNLTGA